MADNFPLFLLENGSVIWQKASRYWLIAEIGMLVLIILNCSGRLISAMEIIVGQPISAIS
jgi:hypothetical protein